MHPSHSHLIAQQIHAERLRRAEAERLARIHLDALPRRPTVRVRLGDVLVAIGRRLTSIGRRIIATASPPTAPSAAGLGGQRGGACAGC